ncbi:MAG: VWA domain-containing protein, partial [Bacteroidales bacterium]
FFVRRFKGGTNIAGALLSAQAELNSGRSRFDSAKVIVLLSDGQAPAAAEATEIKDSGVRIVTIGLGTDVNNNELTAIASSPDDYYQSPDETQLEEIFLSIAKKIRKIAAGTDLILIHRFDATNFEVLPDSTVPTGNSPLTKLPGVFRRFGCPEPIQLTYRLRARMPGNFNLDLGDDFTFSPMREGCKKTDVACRVVINGERKSPDHPHCRPHPHPCAADTPAGLVPDVLRRAALVVAAGGGVIPVVFPGSLLEECVWPARADAQTPAVAPGLPASLVVGDGL